MNPLILGGVVAGVVLLGVVGLGAYLVLGRRQSVVEERLGQFTKSGQVAAAPAQPTGQRSSALGDQLNKALEGRGFAEAISRDLARADLKLNVGEYLALHVIVFFALAGLGWFLGGHSFAASSFIFLSGSTRKKGRDGANIAVISLLTTWLTACAPSAW